MPIIKNLDIQLNSLKDTLNFAQKYLNKYNFNNVICLYGNLGSGKTTLSRYLIQNLLNDKSVEVTSPTFPIINLYQNNKLNLAHLDLYRINSLEELYNIGFSDVIKDNFCIIEWPQIASPMLPPQHTKFYIQFNQQPNNLESRSLHIEIWN